MKLLQPNRLSTTLAATLMTVGLTAGTASGAAFTFSEDFTGADGTLPADWYDTPQFNANDNFSAPITEIQSNELVMERGSTGSTNDNDRRHLAYNGSGSQDWQDYTAEVFWSEDTQNSNTHTTGLIARWQGTSNQFQGYSAIEKGGNIQIYRDLEENGDGTLLATAGLSRTPSNGEVTRMTFTVSGDTLTAELFEDAENDLAFDDSLGSVSVTDSTYATGSAGVKAYFAADNRSATFDDFSVEGTLVPEPASAALLGLGGLLIAGRRRQRG